MKHPYILVAPNGARRTKKDHPRLPVTIEEIVSTAKACFEAGANGIHAHVRDAEGHHVLDVGLYRELLREIETTVPGMDVQVTTEAVGQYSPAEQMAVVRAVQPQMVSIALSELTTHENKDELRHFYFETIETGTEIQHILYEPQEVQELERFVETSVVPSAELSLLFVLGRYTSGQISSPEDFNAFHKALSNSSLKDQAKYMTCAFGLEELNCLVHAARSGSDCRIGFENNILQSENKLALSNEAQVADLIKALQQVQA